MAGGHSSRPDTLTQTDQPLISAQTPLRTGRAIRYGTWLGRIVTTSNFNADVEIRASNWVWGNFNPYFQNWVSGTFATRGWMMNNLVQALRYAWGFDASASNNGTWYSDVVVTL